MPGDYMGNNTQKMVLIAILLSVSIVLNLVERFTLQGFTGLPMVRLGLANIVVLLILYTYGTKDAFAILFLRIVLVAMLSTGLGSVSFLLSFSGGMVAFLLMVTFKTLKGFTVISVSIMGSLGHAFGQIFMAIFVLATDEIVFLLPVLMMLSVPTGIFVGLTTQRLIKILGPQMGLINE